MADKLIFPIGFDLESGIKQTERELDSYLKRLQRTMDGKPLTIRANFDTSRFTTFENALRGSIQHITDDATNLKKSLDEALKTDNSANINRITEAMQKLEAAWKALPNNQKFDENGQLTSKAQQMVDKYNQLSVSLNSYGQTLAQVSAKIKKAADEEIRDAKRAAEEEDKAVKKRVAALQKLRKIMSDQTNSVSAITAKLQLYQRQLNSLDTGSAKFEKVAAKVRELSQRLSEAQAKVKSVTQTAATENAKHVQSVNQVTNAYHNQETYVSRLIKRLAVYAGFQQVSSFLTNVREVTAQFELQRISLGAIIQDQERANSIFGEIKNFALKSPVKILDLTRYTKQLAAYRIETDKLFETTKRLADVSVGLGVDMDRLILAYGETRASDVMNAKELRQFAMMGIPMLELLSEKLSEIKGKTISTGEAFEMIKKRMVHFDVVAEIFQDLTNKGGTFYNMQEKQGNTLFGLWAKLGDAASVMYDEIGNTDSVNAGMRNLIQLFTDLMKNWRLVGRELGVLGATFAIIHTSTKLSTVNTQQATAATTQYAAAQERLNAAKRRGSSVAINAANASMRAAKASRIAANATNMWTAAMYRLVAAGNSLKAFFLSNWVTLTIAAVAAIGTAIYSAVEKANRLKNELDDIAKSGAVETESKVFAFKKLADEAVNAAEGSKKQRDALDELHRVYKDIIPAEQLTIENLVKMRELGYEPLIAAIKEYVAQRTLQKQIDAATNEYTSRVIADEKKVRELLSRGSISNWFNGIAWSPVENLNADEISEVFGMVKKLARETSKDWKDIWIEAIKSVTDISDEQEEKIRRMLDSNLNNTQQNKYNNMMKDIVKNTRALSDETQNLTKSMEAETGNLGRYTDAWEKVQQRIGNATIKGATKGTFAYDRAQINLSIKQYTQYLKDALGDAWNDSFASIEENVGKSGDKMSVLFFDKIMNKKTWDKLTVAQQKAIQKVKDAYDGLIPTDRTVNTLQTKLLKIADSFGVNTDNIKQYLMDSGEDITKYAKRVKESIDSVKTEIKKMETINKLSPNPYNPAYSKEELTEQKEQLTVLEAFMKFLEDFVKTKGGSKQDPRLQNLKEEISLVQKLYNEYKQLEKQEGATRAAIDMEKMAGESIKALSDKYGIALPKTAKDLTSALEILYNKMAKLPRKVFPNLDKDLRELRWTIEKVDIDDAQKKIEEQLKKLSDKISRTKVAKEFYDRILSQTGDAEMAATLTMNVYGGDGEGLFEQTVEQLQTYFSGVEVELPVNFKTQQIDYKALRKTAEQMRSEMGEEAYRGVISIADAGEKDVQKMIEGWLKATEKAKTYSDKLADIYRTTAMEIERIRKESDRAQVELGNLLEVEDPTDEQQKRVEALRDMIEVYDELRERFEAKRAKEQTALAYEAFKDSPMYVQMFDDLDNASTTMLENMRSRLIALRGEWRNLDPTQLKELQSRLNEIDKQRAQRNPFKTLGNAIRDYRKYMKAGEADGRTKSRAEADEKLETAAKVRIEAEKEYIAILEKEGATKEDIAKAKGVYDGAAADEKAAAKAVENWKKVEDAIKLSANELFQMLNWAGDIGKAVADISEAMGADEEDVEYWNTVADSLSNIAGGIQDIVSAAMSGNMVGVVSSVITAIPKMFTGFVSLFNAGKIRNANKEIRTQAELLEQLEYAYSRLEKAAEGLFGAEYIANYNQQLKILNAQAEAYRKQAEAEKKKGKKADKERLKEYENSARDTMNEIADMQGKIMERMTGTDVASAARDFAKAWLDAYVSFGNTADAIKDKFKDMIKNMIVESVMAKTVQMALQPLFDEAERMYKDGASMTEVLTFMFSQADKKANEINNGLKVNAKYMESLGIDLKSLRDTESNYTGIKRDIASASEEQITGLAATMNTWSYYVSFVPGISADVAAMRQILESGVTTPVTSKAGEWTDWQQQAMANYVAIQRNTADTVVECRRAAVAAEAAVTQLRRVITNNPSSTTYGVKVFA